MTSAPSRTREALVTLLNRLRLPPIAMRSRTLIRWYFDRKYRNRDPYGVTTARLGGRYHDILSLVSDKHFERALDIGCGEGGFSAMLLKV